MKYNGNFHNLPDKICNSPDDFPNMGIWATIKPIVFLPNFEGMTLQIAGGMTKVLVQNTIIDIEKE